MSSPAEIVGILRQGRFDEAASDAEALLREAAANGRLTDVARQIVMWQGVFRNHDEAAESVTYFRAVHRVLAELAGADSPAEIAAAANLAGILGSVDQLDEAIALRERVWTHVQGRFRDGDSQYLMARDSLAFLYRRAGNEAAAAALFGETGICAHLAPVEKALRTEGSAPYSVGQPWSDNCHIWVFFDQVLDCEGLMERLRLDQSCVAIHDHRGTHDGSERGLVCTVHHDGVMGRHPGKSR
jgi:hypothetical protein